MEKILVSACLMGTCCRYSGGSNYHQGVMDYLDKNKDRLVLLPVCPEVDGGLSTPRDPAEIQGDRVITKTGKDVTKAFEAGAMIAAELAKRENCRMAILKERSPSCGSGKIYDGTFTGTLTDGDGKTAALLKAAGVMVYGESRLPE